MRVLVTGGTGSIGQWTTRYLQEHGHHPVVYDFDVYDTYLHDILDDITVVEGDIRDYDHLESTLDEHDVDRVIHLAKLLETSSKSDPVAALDVNLIGSGNVLKAAHANGIDRVVFSSSKSVFAEVTGDHAPPNFEPLPPDWPKFDRTTAEEIPFYTLTNKLVEYFGIRYARYREMEFVITRFGSTWGPGKIRYDDISGSERTFSGGTLVSNMIDRAIRDEPTEVAPRRDNFVYTKDIAQGVARCALSDDVEFDHHSREMLLDAGRPYAMADFVDALHERFPDLDIRVSESGDEFDHRTGIQCVFDSTRPRQELGYDPAFDDVGTAIDDYLATEEQYRSTG